MRVLILGGAGMLGHKLLETFYRNGTNVSCTLRGGISDSPLDRIDLFRKVPVHEHVDALSHHTLRQKLEEIRPDVIVNCIGIIKQRDQAKLALESISVNSLLPHLLAEWAKDWNGRVIHFSTDCVFSGRRGRYTVKDRSDAEDLYGQTKFLGEVQSENGLTLRTSIIGRELTQFASLVEWFLAQEGNTIRGFTRASYSGMTTTTMADLVHTILDRPELITGLQQVVSDPISKYDLLMLLREAYGLDVQIEADDSFFCDRSMVGSGFTESLDFTVPPWRDQICRMSADPTPYEAWR